MTLYIYLGICGFLLIGLIFVFRFVFKLIKEDEKNVEADHKKYKKWKNRNKKKD